MPKPLLTYESARSAGQDAGNRSARRNGRTVWDTEDYQAAADETVRLLDIIEGITHTNREASHAAA
jgi:hypothetical protein